MTDAEVAVDYAWSMLRGTAVGVAGVIAAVTWQLEPNLVKAQTLMRRAVAADLDNDPHAVMAAAVEIARLAQQEEPGPGQRVGWLHQLGATLLGLASFEDRISGAPHLEVRQDAVDGTVVARVEHPGIAPD